jgi:dipeptidase
MLQQRQKALAKAPSTRDPMYGGEMARTFRERVHEARRVVRMVSPEQAKAMIDRGQVMVIDVGEAWQIEVRGTGLDDDRRFDPT